MSFSISLRTVLLTYILTFDSISALTFLLMPNSGETRSACLDARKDDDSGDDAGVRKADTGVTYEIVARRALLKNARASGRFRLLQLQLLLPRLLPKVRGDDMLAGAVSSRSTCACC